MGGVDRGDDDLTFKVNFSSEGVGKLRERVTEKLKEFMGDYTDDTLVEYVIVLLKNGRRKQEARNELNVFLGDDSESFVSWLWDHLGSSLNQYVQHFDPDADVLPKIKTIKVDQAGRTAPHHVETESQNKKPSKSLKNRHGREWRKLAGDVEQLPIPEDGIHKEEESHLEGDRSQQSLSPRAVRRKRSRPEETQGNKRGDFRQATINAPRRLLQFAVRDAVSTSRPLIINSESPLKRLRSVISTSKESSLEEQPHKIHQMARVPRAMVTAIKAVREAALDVTNRRSSNVFDRLSRDADVLDRDDMTINEGGENLGIMNEEFHPDYSLRDDYNGEYARTTSMPETRQEKDSPSHNHEYDFVNDMGREFVNVSRSGSSGRNRSENLLMVHHSMAKSANVKENKLENVSSLPVTVPDTSNKILSSFGKTQKQPQYEEARQILEINTQKSVQDREAMAAKSGLPIMKENSNVAVVNGNAKPEPDEDVRKVSQKTQLSVPGIYPTGLPVDDADSRTIFVSNVHFGATKDSLSRHFNKFGEVLKVVILTDAATGQPKGSAYVEFMRKEAAHNALSLDGTSFMSRILKVVKKNAAPPEIASVVSWPRGARGSALPAARFGWSPFPRGVPSVYRPRIPVKPGPRSMQWKRDAQPAPSENSGLTSGNAFQSRSLTYVRTELKAATNSGNT